MKTGQDSLYSLPLLSLRLWQEGFFGILKDLSELTDVVEGDIDESIRTIVGFGRE